MKNPIIDNLTTIWYTETTIDNNNRLPPSIYLEATASGLGEIFKGYQEDTGRLMPVSVELPIGSEQASSEQVVSVLRVPDSDGIRYFVNTEDNQGLDPAVWGVFVPTKDSGRATWLNVKADENGKLRPSDAGELTSMEEHRRRIIVGAVVDVAKKQRESMIIEYTSLLDEIYTGAANNARKMISNGVAKTPTGVQETMADGEILKLSIPRWATVSGHPTNVEITRLTGSDGSKFIISELSPEDRGSTTSNEPEAIRTWGVDTATGEIVLSDSSVGNEVMKKEYPNTYQALARRELMNLLQGIGMVLKAQESRFESE